LSCDDLLLFLAEVTPAESKIVLGWINDTRRLLIALTVDKHRAWSDLIDSVMTNEHVMEKDL